MSQEKYNALACVRSFAPRAGLSPADVSALIDGFASTLGVSPKALTDALSEKHLQGVAQARQAKESQCTLEF